MSLSILNRLQDNPSLFKGKKTIVVGDIALDRTFRCRHASPSFHATHGNERILDIEPNGDDFGAVGSSANTCLLCQSFEADSLLITVIGNDEEGRRVKEVLARQQVRSKCLRINDVQTITRLRFFVFSENYDTYDLLYRMDKEPDYDLSYSKVRRLIHRSDFLRWFRDELATSDALLLNDTEKGLLSAPVLEEIAKVVRNVNKARENTTCSRVVTIIDPKNDWDKFKGFPVDIFKPNEREASQAVGLSRLDFGDDKNLKILAERLYEKYRDYFQKIVITLRHHGAALLETDNEGAVLYRFPVIEAKPSAVHVATHCGDMFASALVLGLAIGEDIFSATAFANCVGSLQFNKITGTKVTREDLLKEENITYLRSHYRSHRQVDKILSEKERIVRDILNKVGGRIDYRSAHYRWNGRCSGLIVSPEFSREIDKLGHYIQPGKIVFIHGESGSGKGAILENLQVFVERYTKDSDCHNAHDVLDEDGKLEKVMKKAEERKTCIVLDEIQAASDAGIARLLSAFPQQDFGKPFCLVCAGHYDSRHEALQDLFHRSSQFEVLPYRNHTRRYDLPFLIASILRQTQGSCRRVKNITALVLYELLRCDYDSQKSKNWRSLKEVLTSSCRAVTGNTLEWKHLNFEVIGVDKARVEPSIQGLDYVINILG